MQINKYEQLSQSKNDKIPTFLNITFKVLKRTKWISKEACKITCLILQTHNSLSSLNTQVKARTVK